jgi:hypothetical protein
VVNVTAAHDGLYDPGEEVHVTVDTGTGYTVGSPNAAGITIADDAAGTIDLTGGSGTFWYDVPWSEIDPDEATQSIPLTDFTLVFGGQTFDESSPYFTVAPTAEFEYGDLVNITFAITFAAPVAGYASLAVAGGEATAVDAVTTDPEVVAVADNVPASLLLNFDGMTFDTTGTTPWTFRAAWGGQDSGPVMVTIPQSGTPGATPTAVRDMVKTALKAKGWVVESDGTTLLVITGAPGKHLTLVDIYANTFPLPTGPTVQGRIQGDAPAKPEFIFRNDG